jgi:hypothetical protein
MKKSLNNRLRGKRLVTGDENEVTSNEILIEDKDGKIAVKQRGAEGKMEDIADGETINLWSYLIPSNYSCEELMQKKASNCLLDFFSTKDYSPNMYNDKVMILTEGKNLLKSDSNIQLKVPNDASTSCVITESNKKGIYSYCRWSTLKGTMPSVMILKYSCYYPNVTVSAQPLALLPENKNSGNYCDSIFYCPSSNILLYYIARSSNFIIAPEEIAKTLKIYKSPYSDKYYLNGSLLSTSDDHFITFNTKF